MGFKVKNILVATNHLHMLGGSETFTYTLIEELSKRQHYNVEYFTFNKGIVSSKIENNLNVSFMSKSRYDLILANHNTCVDFLFKKGFIIQTCHGIYPKLEQPSHRANGFVSISEEVQNHLALKGFSSIKILNGINLIRFKSLKNINTELKTVLSLCQSEEANSFIKSCCDSINVNFIKADKNIENIWEVNELINESDLVIGLGRSAYEAMSCGRPVVVYDNRSYFDSYGDGYVKDVLGLSLINNCSGRYFKYKFNEKDLIRELLKYRKDDGLFFRKFSERELDINKNLDLYINYWKSLIDNKRKKKLNFIKKIVGIKIYKFLRFLYSKFLKK